MDNSKTPTRPPEIRRLWPSDKTAFRDHLLRLDPHGRHNRFGGGVSDDFIEHYAESCFGGGDLVYGAFVAGGLHGAGELRSTSAIWNESLPLGRHVKAEAAFSVEPNWRRLGIGEKLFARVARAASNHGVETIEIVCLPGNDAMLKLAAKFKTRFDFVDNQIEGKLTARRPTAFSLARELAGDVVDFAGALADVQLRALAANRPGQD